ncbi:MAG: enoyl-CoA hydratase [Pseudomonadota bacterium]
MSQAQATAVSTTPDELVLRSGQDGVTTLTLNRPAARNALSFELMSALDEALVNAGADPSTKVVILAAEGPAFCAGHDLKQIRSQPREDVYAQLFDLCSTVMKRIVRLPKPVIAQVHATATAAGCQLVASCDLAVASDTARFATPGVNIGLFCSTPMVALSRNVAPKHAMEMLLTGDMITAADAHRIGLVNRVVPGDQLADSTMALAQQIASKSPLSVAIGKEAFYRQAEMDLDEAYSYASAVMTRNMMADDAAEGIDAFLTKRRPTWRGT